MNKIYFYKQIKKKLGLVYPIILKSLNYLLDFILDQDQILKEISNLKYSEIKTLLKSSQINKSDKNYFLKNNNDCEHFSIFKYKDPRIKSLVWQLKFNNNRKISIILAKFLEEEINQIADKNKGIKNWILIPIPIHRKRRSERGYNQCEWLCEEIVKINKKKLVNFKLFYFPKFLVRDKYSVKQSWVSKKERIENIRNSFSISKNCKCRNFFKNREFNKNNSVFLIIDDVYTTGSTTNEAALCISKFKFKIISLTVAN